VNVWSIWHTNQLLSAPKGDIMEFGVYGGSSFVATIDLMFRRNMFKTRRLFGFDSFKGLPKEEDGVAIMPKWKEGNYYCRKETVWRGIHQYMKENNAENLPLDKIFLIEGWFEDSLTDELKRKHNMKSVGLAYVDVDLYVSCKHVLRWLKGLWKSGTILCFDDWIANKPNMGEHRAFREFVEQNKTFKFHEEHLHNNQHVVKVL